MGRGTGIGRVRGLGSAKHGAHHWIIQRFTAAGNLLLVGWLFISFWMLPALDHGTVTAWIGNPLVAVPLMLMIVSIFWHLRLGLQVFFEDYIHNEGMKFGVMLLLTFYAIGGAAIGIFSIAKIAFTSASGAAL